MPAEFDDPRGASLAWLSDRWTTEDDPLRTWAPATEQTSTPASAAAKRRNFEIIPRFLVYIDALAVAAVAGISAVEVDCPPRPTALSAPRTQPSIVTHFNHE